MNLIVHPDGSALHVPTHLLDVLTGHVPHPFERVPLPGWLQPPPLSIQPEFTPSYLTVYTLTHR